MDEGKEQAPGNLVLIEEERFKRDFARSKGVDVTHIYARYLEESFERRLKDSIKTFGLKDGVVQKIRENRKKRQVVFNPPCYDESI